MWPKSYRIWANSSVPAADAPHPGSDGLPACAKMHERAVRRGRLAAEGPKPQPRERSRSRARSGVRGLPPCACTRHLNTQATRFLPWWPPYPSCSVGFRASRRAHPPYPWHPRSILLHGPRRRPWLGQLTAFFTRAAILASSSGVRSSRAKDVGQKWPSSRCAPSLKPRVA